MTDDDKISVIEIALDGHVQHCSHYISWELENCSHELSGRIYCYEKSGLKLQVQPCLKHLPHYKQSKLWSDITNKEKL